MKEKHLASALLCCLALAAASPAAASDRPNILWFMTDDLDSQLDGDSPLSKTRSWIGDEGVTFLNAFVSTPVCCPSRASFLTGMYQVGIHSQTSAYFPCVWFAVLHNAKYLYTELNTKKQVKMDLDKSQNPKQEKN